MSKPSLALAMIVKNEAENLPVLFESIKDCFDEIHITDTGSTDGTIDILKSLGAKVHHFDWVNDFAAARNASFDPVKTDYVMWMDGDDVLAKPDAFKMWRQDVMHLADYWFAPYHYAHNEKGESVCTFIRERVFKTAKKPAWKYFVHEGVIPKQGSIMQQVGAWHIKHRRSAADLAKDKSRNLDLFLKNKDQLDARMRYYFGKEYFENGKPFEAVMELQKAIADPSLLLHDRLLAMQYLCYGFISLNQHSKALDMAHMGLMLAPNRAEFHCIVGDSHCRLGKPLDAVPSYQAARFCNPNAMGLMSQAIFSSMSNYTSYPNNQLAKIYGQVHAFDEAIGHAQESVMKFHDIEAQGILSQLLQMKDIQTIYKNAKPCEDIVFTTPPQTAYEFDPGIAEKRSMGGSETALIEMARELRKQSGRPVRVFSMRSDHKTFEGVDYIPISQAAGYFKENKPHFHVAWRHTYKLTDAPTFIWSHDLQTPGVEHGQNYDKVLCLTPFHKRYMALTQGVPAEKIHLTRNGVKPERFIEIMDKDPYRFVFGSSPDRGLIRCMKVLDRVRKVYPQVNLHVHYGIEHLDKYGLGALKAELEKMMHERKDWITYHGATEQSKLMESYKKSAYNIQPSDWIETSCISARELMYCGVYAMFRDVGGVSDTLRDAHDAGMALLVDREGVTDEDLDYYADQAIQAIKEERYKRIRSSPEEWSWAGVAKQWLSELPQAVKQG